MYLVFNMFIEKNSQGENGILNIQSNEKQDVINVNGEFLVVDGILAPKQKAAYVKNEQALEKEVKRLTYNKIRQYNYPQGSITAYMKITDNGCQGLYRAYQYRKNRERAARPLYVYYLKEG